MLTEQLARKEKSMGERKKPVGISSLCQQRDENISVAVPLEQPREMFYIISHLVLVPHLCLWMLLHLCTVAHWIDCKKCGPEGNRHETNAAPPCFSKHPSSLPRIACPPMDLFGLDITFCLPPPLYFLHRIHTPAPFSARNVLPIHHIRCLPRGCMGNDRIIIRRRGIFQTFLWPYM